MSKKTKKRLFVSRYKKVLWFPNPVFSQCCVSYNNDRRRKIPADVSAGCCQLSQACCMISIEFPAKVCFYSGETGERRNRESGHALLPCVWKASTSKKKSFISTQALAFCICLQRGGIAFVPQCTLNYSLQGLEGRRGEGNRCHHVSLSGLFTAYTVDGL